MKILDHNNPLNVSPGRFVYFSGDAPPQGGAEKKEGEKQTPEEFRKAVKAIADKHIGNLKPTGLIKDLDRISKIADDLYKKASDDQLVQLTHRLAVCSQFTRVIGSYMDDVISPEARSKIWEKASGIVNNSTFLSDILGSTDPNETLILDMTQNLLDINNIHFILKSCSPALKPEADKIRKMVYDTPSMAAVGRREAEKLEERSRASEADAYLDQQLGGGKAQKKKDETPDEGRRVFRGAIDKNLHDLQPSSLIKDPDKITELADELVKHGAIELLSQLSRRLYVCVEFSMLLGPAPSRVISPEARSKLWGQVNDIANNSSFLTENLGSPDARETLIMGISQNLRDINDIHRILTTCPPAKKAEADKIKKTVYNDPSIAAQAKIDAQKLV